MEKKQYPPKHYTGWRWSSHPSQHEARGLKTLQAEAGKATPASRFAESPRLAAKHRRALDRALKRGRPAQIERKLSAFTGIQQPKAVGAV